MAITQFPTASSGGLQQYEQIFTSSGTWTKPSGVKTVEITIAGGTGGNSSYYPTSAGGYWRGIVDVSAVSTVAVTVGAAAGSGGTGGTSSFGSLVAAPGNLAGAYYFPSKTGYGAAIATSVSTAGLSDRWTGIASGDTYAKVSNDGNFCYIQGNLIGYGISSTNAGQSWSSSSIPNNGNATKILSYNGNYISVPLSAPSGNPYSNIYYSTNPLSAGWTAISSSPSSGYWYGATVGPNGFLIHGGSGWWKSTNGSTWTSVTPSGLSGGSWRLQGTSTRYYAFQYDSTNSTAYTSTDGTNWTSISLPTNHSAYSEERNYASWKEKVYYVVSGVQSIVIDGTSASLLTTTGNGGFFMINLPYWVSSNNVYSVESPLTKLFTMTTTGFIPLLLPSATYFRSQNANVGTIDRVSLVDGSNGFGTWTPGSATQGSPGAMSVGVSVPNTTYMYPIPGRGTEDGWCQGAVGFTNFTLNASTFGSGTNNTSGNQGAVRVRWWA